MSIDAATDLDANRARFLATVGGVLYLIIIVLGATGEAVVRGNIVVPGDATATAANIRWSGSSVLVSPAKSPTRRGSSAALTTDRRCGREVWLRVLDCWA